MIAMTTNMVVGLDDHGVDAVLTAFCFAELCHRDLEVLKVCVVTVVSVCPVARLSHDRPVYLVTLLGRWMFPIGKIHMDAQVVWKPMGGLVMHRLRWL
jgi:hypothetical protein